MEYTFCSALGKSQFRCVAPILAWAFIISLSCWGFLVKVFLIEFFLLGFSCWSFIVGVFLLGFLVELLFRSSFIFRSPFIS